MLNISLIWPEFSGLQHWSASCYIEFWWFTAYRVNDTICSILSCNLNYWVVACPHNETFQFIITSFSLYILRMLITFSYWGALCLSRLLNAHAVLTDGGLWLIYQVAKRLEKTSRYFKQLGSLGFWGQLVCTIVSAVILSFSAVITGKITSPVTFYTTAGGIAAAFVSVFWSFGYIRLSERLRRTANDPAKVTFIFTSSALIIWFILMEILTDWDG